MPIDDSDLEEARVRYAMRAAVASLLMCASVVAKLTTSSPRERAEEAVDLADALMEALGPIP